MKGMVPMQTLLPRASLAIGGILFAFYLGFVNYTEPNEVGVAWNRFIGDLQLQDDAGFHLTAPWVSVSRIDIRPIRVCVTSAGRGFNCKLIRFEPTAYREFVAVEGFRYWWWANRVSFNLGYHEEYRGMKDLLRGYAYSVKRYSFVTTIMDYEAE